MNNKYCLNCNEKYCNFRNDLNKVFLKKVVFWCINESCYITETIKINNKFVCKNCKGDIKYIGKYKCNSSL